MHRGHFETAHRRPQCERCYNFFYNRDDLQDHRKAVPCIRNSDTLKEGIDDSQWDKIWNLLKVKKRGMTSSEKKDHDYYNWFEIWKILFPDIPQPEDPCKLVTTSCEPLIILILLRGW
jgi:hypothetical protein